VFVALGNLAPIIGVVVASFSPPRVYLQTEKDGLEFNRDESAARGRCPSPQGSRS